MSQIPDIAEAAAEVADATVPAKQAHRRQLGGWMGAGSRARVFLTRDAIEVDEYDGWNIERRRVFLDDIVQVSLHHARSWIGFWSMACMATMFLIIGVAAASSGPPELVWGFVVVASPFILGALLFLRSYTFVTIVGRRTRTRMSWWLSRAKAAATFHEVCRVAGGNASGRQQVGDDGRDVAGQAQPEQ